MKSSSVIEYYLVFDTNVLYQAYDKKSDFTAFSFNSTYDNVIDMIDQLDIYTQVVLEIPSVVWKEMEQQIIEKHDELLQSYRYTIKKRLFPEYSIQENTAIDYPKYIQSKIADYRSTLSSRINVIEDLPIASNSRFDSIVNRAFEKLPPFEGKEKKSDKGFKDALLWESILEFALKHNKSKIIFYSKDNIFDEFLKNEFEKNVENSSIFICKNEKEVKEQLEIWAKEIDKYSYQPIENFDENKEIIDWLNSENFLKKIIDPYYGLAEKGRLIYSTVAHLISIDNIECIASNEDSKEYYIEIVLQLEYKFRDGGGTSETITTGVQVEAIFDDLYFIEDAYRLDEDESEI